MKMNEITPNTTKYEKFAQKTKHENNSMDFNWKNQKKKRNYPLTQNHSKKKKGEVYIHPYIFTYLYIYITYSSRSCQIAHSISSNDDYKTAVVVK